MSNLFETTHNPDVLSCIANLSNDEVFTPPELVNQMLDMLPDELWSDPQATFLDPACKSGVFLREIAKRLIKGLEDEIPDLEERLEHIYKKQLYGIAITELTSLLSRRSLYCSKWPNSVYSIVQFDNPKGNIDYMKLEHSWEGGRCRFCGAAEREYKREEGLEQYAYEFIHLDNPEEVLPVKFDVIIGNPPYQMSDGGGEGSSAVPLYDKFIVQALRLNPRYLTMVVPARWYSGGRGLDDFRDQMLCDERLSVIHDFQETDLCFPGLNIRGGVCYFLWDRGHRGDVTVFNHSSLRETSVAVRPLLEEGATTFIRNNAAVGILKKVQSKGEGTYGSRVLSSKPFGMRSNFEDFHLQRLSESDLILYRSRRGSSADKRVYVDRKYVTKNADLIDKIKVVVSKASPGGDEIPHAILGRPFIVEPGAVCTETYLVVDMPYTKEEAERLVEYMSTKFSDLWFR